MAVVSSSYPGGPGHDTPIPASAVSPGPRRLTPKERGELIDAVRRWLAAGFVVHPVKPDGSKALVAIPEGSNRVEPEVFPDTYQAGPRAGQPHPRAGQRNPRAGKYEWGWKRIATGELPPLTAEAIAWYIESGKADGIAVVLGPVSGNVEMVEVEGRARDLLPKLREAAERRGVLPLLERIAAGFTEESPSRGLHFLLRVIDGKTTNGMPLAARPEGESRRVLAETKGEGGIAVVFPSAGRTHGTGRAYRLLRGGPESVESVTVAERDALYQAFRDLDEMPPPEPVVVRPDRQGPVRPRRSGEVSTADDYAERTSWDQLLTSAGWTRVGGDGESCSWRRPGKAAGISATTNGAVFYAFTTSSSLPAGVGLTKFSVFAHLHHGGDLSAASRELWNLGFGSRGDDDQAGGELATLERPPQPGGPARGLDDYRRELAESVAAAVPVAGLHLFRAPTGAGKSTATSAAIAGVGCSLTVLPDHANVRERVEAMRAVGIDAVAYPQPTKDNCGRLEDFARVQRMGLTPGAVLCPGCPLKDGCEYRAAVKAADAAQHRVGTHERLRRSGTAAKDAAVVVIDEAPEAVIAPTLTVPARLLAAVEALAKSIRDHWYSTADDDQKAFAGSMLAVAEAVNCTCRGIAGPGRTVVDLPLGMAAPDKWQWLVYRMIRQSGAGDLDADALQLVTRAAAGELTGVEVVTDVTERTTTAEDGSPVVSRNLHHYVVASWRPSIPATASVILLDGTAEAENVAAVAGRPVADRTPEGRVENVQAVTQLVDDIARGASSRTVAGVVDAFLAENPGVTRLGIIGHQHHVRDLVGTERRPGLLGPQLSRIAKSCWFGAGPDRASNDWHTCCDHLLILGTPRVNPGEYRRWLVQHGLEDAAGLEDGTWTPRPWEGTTTEGGTVAVARAAYQDASWDRAYQATTRAALLQAIGRGRSTLPEGIAVTVVTNEPLGLPVRPPLEATAEVVREVLQLALELAAAAGPGAGEQGSEPGGEGPARSALSPIRDSYREKCASRVRSADLVQAYRNRRSVAPRAAVKAVAAAVKAGRLVRFGRGWVGVPGGAPSVPLEALPAAPRLVASPPPVLAVVAAPVPPPEAAPVVATTQDAVPPELLDLVEERAAVLEFDGGLTREAADRRARSEVLGGLPTPPVIAPDPVEDDQAEAAPVLVAGVDHAAIAARGIPFVAAVLDRFPGVVRRVVQAAHGGRAWTPPPPRDPMDRSRCSCGETAVVAVPIHEGRSVRHDCARCDRFRGFSDWYSLPATPSPLPRPQLVAVESRPAPTAPVPVWCVPAVASVLSAGAAMAGTWP